MIPMLGFICLAYVFFRFYTFLFVNYVRKGKYPPNDRVSLGG